MFNRLRGQSLVELALVAPVFVVLVVLIVDLGRIFAGSISATNSAREGAYYGSRGVAGTYSDASIRSAAAGEGLPLTPNATYVAVAYPSPDLLAVTVRSPFQPVAPMVRALWGGREPAVAARAAFLLPVPTTTPLLITPSTPLPSSTVTRTPTTTRTVTSTPTRTLSPTGTILTPTRTLTAGPTSTRTSTPVPQIQQVQKKAAASTSGSVTATFDTTPTQGNLLIAIVGAHNCCPTLSLAGWNVATAITGAPPQTIFYKYAGVSEPRNVTATRSSGNNIGIQIFEYSGIATSSPLDRTAVGTNGSNVSRNGGAFTCGSVTTTQARELIIVGISHRANSTVTVNNSWSNSFVEQFDLKNSNSRLRIASAERIVTSQTTYTTGSTLISGSGSGVTRCMTATFKAAF